MKLLLIAALSLLTTAAFADFDLGDLPPCNYPTQFGNPAHSMTGKAWLGECITMESEPYGVNLDGCDDGVTFLNLPWMPCEVVQVQVTITAGPNYTDNPLWLNGWKDGNLDGDFCDELCASEWIVQNVPVTPGTYTFSFVDPGVFDMGVYDGVFRFRLTGRSLGRMGFGFYDPFNCEDSPFCGNFGADSLGEVEDYWIDDAQLDVEMMSPFQAIPGDNQVTLSWSTASETSSDHFEIVRNNVTAGMIEAAGYSNTERAYSWVDNGVVNGTAYTYELVAVDILGNRDVLGTESTTPSASEGVVTEYALHQNYPNPFNPSTSITFDLLEAGNVKLAVYNVIGQEVATLVNGNLSGGRHTFSFDAAGLPNGLYLYRLETAGFTDQKKMLLMK
jgi:hypothetical protein